MRFILKKTISKFFIIGTIGFLIDATILHFLAPKLGYIEARMISFFCAVTITWMLNRKITFESTNRLLHYEWTRYVAATALGSGINFFCYSMLVLHTLTFKNSPVMALAIGSLIAAAFNYFASKMYVFRTT